VEQVQKFSFRNKNKKTLNQNGQAVVEYVLLLVITVGLVLAAKKAFNSLDQFMNSYIGDYTVCLMEYGELPSLGISESALKKHVGAANCDTKFAGFTFENGRPPTGGAGASSGGAKTGSAAGSKNAAANADKADRNSRDTDKKNGSSKKSGAGRGSSPYTRNQISRSNDLGTADGAANTGNKKVKVIEDEADDENARRGRGRGYGETKRARTSQLKYKTITGPEAEKIEKQSARLRRAPAKSVVATAPVTGNQFGPYKKIFSPPETKPTVIKQEDESNFAFGNILRWLIIGGMIIAIIVFFGGQIMNYSNSE